MRGVLSILRTGFTLLAISCLVLLLGWLGYTFVAQPQITVTAPAGSTISLVDVKSGLHIAQTRVNGSSATLRTGIGSYKVTIDNKSGGQAFYTETAWLKRVSLQFAPPKQPNTTLLAHQVAYNAIGTSNTFAYLNTSAQTIEQLSSNTKVVIDNSASVQAMKPIAGNRSIVLTHDALYLLQNGHLNPLSTGSFPDNVSSLAIGTNPGQESFAVLANQTLYWYQSPSAQPQRILTLSKQADQLAVGGDQIIAYSTRMPDAKQDIRYAYTPTYAVDPLLISVTSDSQHTLGRGPIVDASISPDGQYATVEQRGSAHTDIVRLTDGATTQSVENADTLSPVWISNTRYVYGKGSNVWMYNVDTLSAYTIATLPSDQLVTSITYNTQQQDYLVTTYPNEQGAAIYQLQ